MSDTTIRENGIYILLFIRTSPHTLNNFHWALYVHHNGHQVGTKYHVKQQGAGWITDHGVTIGVLKEFLLVGLFQIGVIPTGQEAYTDQQLRTYDAMLNDLPDITCKTWLFRVLRLLQKEIDGTAILKCADLLALEEEILTWGNDNAEGTETNRQPRPIAVSSKFALNIDCW